MPSFVAGVVSDHFYIRTPCVSTSIKPRVSFFILVSSGKKKVLLRSKLGRIIVNPTYLKVKNISNISYIKMYKSTKKLSTMIIIYVRVGKVRCVAGTMYENTIFFMTIR